MEKRSIEEVKIHITEVYIETGNTKNILTWPVSTDGEVYKRTINPDYETIGNDVTRFKNSHSFYFLPRSFYLNTACSFVR